MSKDAHGHEEKEELVKVSVMLEDEQLAQLKEIAVEYKAKLGQKWTVSAVVRVAVGDFLTKMWRMS